MQTFISKANLELAVLYRLYVAIHSDHAEMIVDDIRISFNPHLPYKRIELALESLYEQKKVSWHRSNLTFWSINNTGISAVEAGLAQKDSFLRLFAELGDAYLTDRIAPAADRIVSFNHNQPEAVEIANGINETRETVRGANSDEIDEQERARVLSALDAAADYWSAARFRITQYKVGVLMAVEDAQHLLKSTAKATSIDLLVEAIKAFARNFLRIDLDA